jgi:S-formylglutathione hydrolase FrmB
LLSLLGVGALLAVLAVVARPASAQRTWDSRFHSSALGGTLHFEVVLPVDYATSGRRYPVVYFLHGLPAGSEDYRGLGFVQNALDGLGPKAILVVPQGARGGDADPEYLDRGPGRRWATAIASELPRVIDSRYRTIASRKGRALVGVSAGGYGAMHLALGHLSTFAVMQSWSGYFHPTDPTGFQGLDLGSQADNDRANVHAQARKLRSTLRTVPTAIAFYVGKSDTRFAAENEELNQELSRAGISHIFRLYAGGHDQRLWGRYAPAWLALALSHLAPAQ